MAVYEINNLSFTYPILNADAQSRFDRDIAPDFVPEKALDQVNLTVERGEFIVLCGKSGCGKSTLLRHLKTTLTPYGLREGEIRFHGHPLAETDQRIQTASIGYVLQDPDNQIVTDKVWHELAFGLESLGYRTPTIRLRVAEMASFFGIQTWFHRDVASLSGGQKQLLNLAAIMAMQPEVLILDEPTSQLDPIAAVDFLETLQKINRDLGTTILLSEHRLEEVFPMADRAIVMDKGRVIVDAPPEKIGPQLHEMGHDMYVAMPSPVRIAAALAPNDLVSPLTVKEGRSWLDRWFEDHPHSQIASDSSHPAPLQPLSQNTPAVELREVYFRYDRGSDDVIHDLSMAVAPGELYCIVGGNGTGKTTTLALMGGLLRPVRGKVLLDGKDLRKWNSRELHRHYLGVVPQNPQTLFVKNTVARDLAEVLREERLEEAEVHQRIQAIAETTLLTELLDRHPYDLSGGEQQRAALAKVLLLKPRLLLLDEPTKGLDAHFKIQLAEILQTCKKAGVTIVMVSHDIEFCASYADTCAMFFDGAIVTQNTPNRFFAGNSFYTTAANRMARHLFRNAITNEEVISRCKIPLSDQS